MADGQPAIEAGSLRLRDFTAGDVPLIRSASSDPHIPDITSVPSTPGTPEALAYVERQRGRLSSGVGHAYAMARAIDDVAVGYVGLRDSGEGRASFGYWVGPEHRGHGYAAIALQRLSEWAETELSIPRLELYAEPWNVASVRTAETAGFEREGLLRSWQVVGNERRDMWMYSRVSGR